MRQDVEFNSQFPRLKVRSPDGEQRVIELRLDRVTIGRLAECNDLALEPDPEHLVSRQVHCVLERRNGAWWVADNYSVNGTFLVKAGAMEPVRAPTPLTVGDVVRIAGRHEGAGLLYWELQLDDPHRTRPVSERPSMSDIEFNLSRQELFVTSGGTRKQIALRPQERALLRHMARRNEDAGRVPVLCSHEELMQAVWGDTDRSRNELAHLVLSLRRKVKQALGKDVTFIQNVLGSGYRLVAPEDID